jgi:hypothetical protein
MVIETPQYVVASGSAAATAVAHTGAGTSLFTHGEVGVARRTLVVTWTGDTTCTIVVSVQAGALNGAANASATVLSIACPAGNTTAQQFILTGAALGVITGTPVLTGNAGQMNAPFATVTVLALAGGTPTVGTLLWDYSGN